MGRKPVIAVTTRLELETDRFYLGRHYCEALEALGAVPLLVPLIASEEYLASVASLVDGLLLPGSDTDVDPLRFGEEPRPGLKKIIPEKEETDLILIREAERQSLPTLGICFGMQILNVSRGGTLIQDIASEVENCVKHEQGVPLARGSHSIEVAPDSYLSRLITKDGNAGTGDPTGKDVSGGMRSIIVNSHHHQAVKELGRDLTATAWTRDGIVECIEDISDKRFVLGVQWHPELSWRNDGLSNSIFKNFVAACRVRN